MSEKKTCSEILMKFRHALFPFIFLLTFSCRTPRQAQYLQGPIDTVALSKINIPEPLIQKGDLIGITVYSDNPELTAAYNQQTSQQATATGIVGSGSMNGTEPASMASYLVDANGFIRFQSLGELQVAGLNKTNLEKILKDKLSPYLKNPYFNIRFLNYRFTILGEVSKQGIYAIPNEKISILEALGVAGDLTTYGEKDSIMIVRETNGKRSFGYLDVSNPNMMLSPYYYLQQNDVVIVKANNKKPTVSDQSNTRNLAIVATIATILTSIAVVFNVFR